MHFQASCPHPHLCMLQIDISYMYINMHSCPFLPHMYKCLYKCCSCGESSGVACRAKGRCRQSALWGGPFGDMPSPRVPLCRPCHAPGLLFRRCHDITQEPTKTDCKAFPLFHVKHLHVEKRLYCPQTFLSLNFQCRDDVSELRQMFWD